jgi:Ca2+:H+ antiporter
LIVCFIALLPLAKILEFGGEQMAFYTGKDIGDFIAVTLNK